jgi:hypothetical protein
MITYIATNTRNGKFYIGSTNNFTDRKKRHSKSKVNYPFQNSLRKDPDKFTWELWSDEYEDPILEQALLDMFFGTGQCYNLSSKATGFGIELCSRKGKDHPMFGKPSPNKDKVWWVNGNDEEVMSFLSPGVNWIRGRSKAHAEKTSKSLIGKLLGEKHPQSELSDKQREEIRTRVKLGAGGNVNQLAKEYGISGRQVRNIIKSTTNVIPNSQSLRQLSP